VVTAGTGAGFVSATGGAAGWAAGSISTTGVFSSAKDEKAADRKKAMKNIKKFLILIANKFFLFVVTH
jgi:hypothetical protein